MGKKRQRLTLDDAAAAMRARALEYPGVVEEHPWGECAFKIKRKVFLFMFRGIHRTKTCSA